MELTKEVYFELKEQKLSRQAIANYFGLPEWKLKKLITINKWALEKPTINTLSFSNLTEESCYWGGFLAADGCVDTKNRVRLMLKHEDIGHLVKFSNFLSSTYKIQENTSKYNRCALEFTSKEVCADLNKYFSIVPNKTSILRPPNISVSLLPHFIRGYFDGDGSLMETFNNKNSKTTSIIATFCSGSIDFTNWIESLLNSLDITFSTQVFENKAQIKLNTLQAEKLCHYMYDTATVYLDRKYELFQKLVLRKDRKVR